MLPKRQLDRLRDVILLLVGVFASIDHGGRRITPLLTMLGLVFATALAELVLV